MPNVASMDCRDMARFQYKERLYRYGVSHYKDNTVFVTEISRLVKRYLYIETVLWCLVLRSQRKDCLYQIMSIHPFLRLRVMADNIWVLALIGNLISDTFQHDDGCVCVRRWAVFGRFVEHVHDDVIKWKHFPRYWPFMRGFHRSPVNSPHKGQWRGALMFSLICARMNGWVNNREPGDLRRHHSHYHVTVMNNIDARRYM